MGWRNEKKSGGRCHPELFDSQGNDERRHDAAGTFTAKHRLAPYHGNTPAIHIDEENRAPETPPHHLPYSTVQRNDRRIGLHIHIRRCRVSSRFLPQTTAFVPTLTTLVSQTRVSNGSRPSPRCAGLKVSTAWRPHSPAIRAVLVASQWTYHPGSPLSSRARSPPSPSPLLSLHPPPDPRVYLCNLVHMHIRRALGARRIKASALGVGEQEERKEEEKKGYEEGGGGRRDQIEKKSRCLPFAPADPDRPPYHGPTPTIYAQFIYL
ncbi:hypothetical protein R3P38DRAFT_3173035 [Favolaschia claudopus]|uniref:Uncharacterized protein n=1 Tax=Favolaschia claudopus TaxID=2862362 RepID=A0AAW0DP09_9AGAR